MSAKLSPAELAAVAADREKVAAKAAAAKAAEEQAAAAKAAAAPPQPAPRPMVVLVGGDADGMRIERPPGEYAVVTTPDGGREAYRKRLLYLRHGHPVEFWAAHALSDDFALRVALDAYRGTSRPDRPRDAA